MPSKPRILKQRDLFSSRLFRVEELELEFSNGEQRVYERLRSGGGGAVLIVPMVDWDRVLLVREYGAGVDDYELSLPKGRVEPNEDFLEAANRELKEEAGYGARKLTLLKLMTQSPNYMQHRTQIVLAQDLYPEKLEGDEPEPLDVEIFHLSQLPELVARNDLTEARTIAALYIVKDLLRGEANA